MKIKAVVYISLMLVGIFLNGCPKPTQHNEQSSKDLVRSYIHADNVKELELLLKNEPNLVDIKIAGLSSGENLTLLGYAIRNGKEKTVKFLLNTYPELVNVKSEVNGVEQTALQLALDRKNADTVMLLVKHGATVSDDVEKRDICRLAKAGLDAFDAQFCANAKKDEEGKDEEEKDKSTNSSKNDQSKRPPFEWPLERQGTSKPSDKAKVEAEERAKLAAEEQVKLEAKQKAQLERDKTKNSSKNDQSKHPPFEWPLGKQETSKLSDKAKVEAEESARLEAEEEAKFEAKQKAKLENDKYAASRLIIGGQSKKLEQLLSSSQDLDSAKIECKEKGASYTLLGCAIKMGKVKVVKSLLENNSKLANELSTMPDRWRLTPLALTIDNLIHVKWDSKNYAIFKLLFEAEEVKKDECNYNEKGVCIISSKYAFENASYPSMVFRFAKAGIEPENDDKSSVCHSLKDFEADENNGLEDADKDLLEGLISAVCPVEPEKTNKKYGTEKKDCISLMVASIANLSEKNLESKMTIDKDGRYYFVSVKDIRKLKRDAVAYHPDNLKNGSGIWNKCEQIAKARGFKCEDLSAKLGACLSFFEKQ